MHSTQSIPVPDTHLPDLAQADDDAIAQLFKIRPGTVYLNHGSFGISPQPVHQVRRQWIEQLDRQPMDFYVRHFEGHWNHAIDELARFTCTAPGNLVFVENATFGMNVVADSFPLAAGDEVLTNNHEYGAVQRIWERACQRRGAQRVVAGLPDTFESTEQIVDAVFEPATASTRLLVVSHITSPTALIMPVKEICTEARRRGIAVCVDGPHAPAHVPLDIDSLDCSFYTASCHKWLSAPLGSGFLYVHPDWHAETEPQLKSWGRLLPAIPQRWQEEFIWSGTRDPSPFLSVPAAIAFHESAGLERFRQRASSMARDTARQLMELTGRQPIGRELEKWYGAMAHVPLPPGDHAKLQEWLWREHGIEVPIVDFEGRWFIRVSHHWYTKDEHIDSLLTALSAVLR